MSVSRAFALLLALIGPAAAQSHPTTLGTTNSGISITTGNTYQTVLTSVSPNTQSRQSITIQNNNTNGDNCWIIFGTSAITPGTTTASTSITIGGVTQSASKFSILLQTGGSYQRYSPYIPADTIYATCASTSDSLYVDTQ